MIHFKTPTIAQPLLAHMAKVKEQISALPGWVRLAIYAQCIFPGAMLVYLQVHHMEIVRTQATTFGQALTELNTMGLLALDQHPSLRKAILDSLLSDAAANHSFGILVMMIFALTILGASIIQLVPLRIKTKPHPPATPAKQEDLA